MKKNINYIILITFIFFGFTKIVNSGYYYIEPIVTYYGPYNSQFYTGAVVESDEKQISVLRQMHQDKDIVLLPNIFNEAMQYLDCKIIAEEMNGANKEVEMFLYNDKAQGGSLSEVELQSYINETSILLTDCVGVYISQIETERKLEEKRLKDEEEKKDNEERKKLIAKAVEECDFDFFDKMSNREKMQTYDKRVECENNQTFTETQAQIQPDITTHTAPVSTYAPHVAVKEEDTLVVPISEVEDDFTSQVSTSINSETIEMTEDELNKTIEESISKELEATKLDEEPKKQNLFKKIFNFLFGWLYS